MLNLKECRKGRLLVSFVCTSKIGSLLPACWDLVPPSYIPSLGSLYPESHCSRTTSSPISSSPYTFQVPKVRLMIHPQNSIHLASWPGSQAACRLTVIEFCETGGIPGWPYLLFALSRKIGFRKLFLIWISAIYNKLLTSVTISILLAVFTFYVSKRKDKGALSFSSYSSSVLGQPALRIRGIFLSGVMGDRNKFRIALYTSHIPSLITLRSNS